MPNMSQTGFRPFMRANETATKTIRRRVASNNGTAIFKYDCMHVGTAAGVWGLATAGSGVTGVSLGASYWDTRINGRREAVFLPVSTTYSSTAFDDYGNTDQSFIYVNDDAVQSEYQCQYSGSTPALTDMTKNANFVASAGSTATGLSGHTLNQATINTTADLDFNIVDYKHNVFNDVSIAAQAKVIVRSNAEPGVPPFSSTNPGTTAV
jgi:hypothetical protein